MSPLVLILAPKYGQHDHIVPLAREGFRVVHVPADEVNVDHVVAHRPAIVAAELIASKAAHTLEFARLLRETPETRPIPFVVYTQHLRAQDIENAARVGAFWVQLRPGDGAKLAGAVRGILRSVSLMAQSLDHLDIHRATNT